MAKRRAEPDPQHATPESRYDAFEELTRKLLKVSKKDLDEVRAREEAAKR